MTQSWEKAVTDGRTDGRNWIHRNLRQGWGPKNSTTRIDVPLNDPQI